jgi:hypothetical protein
LRRKNPPWGPKEEVVEITEIQEPGRKRDEEHKTLGVLSAAYVPEEQVETRTEAIVKALEEAVETKANK